MMAKITIGLANKNAAKQLRRVELGWLNRKGPVYKQVRAPSGGGTRNFSVEKDLTVSDLFEVAVETFFPQGKSKLGNKEDFKMEMRDFKGEYLCPSDTIEEMYARSKLKMLRFYLHTELKCAPEQVDVFDTNVSIYIKYYIQWQGI